MGRGESDRYYGDDRDYSKRIRAGIPSRSSGVIKQRYLDDPREEYNKTLGGYGGDSGKKRLSSDYDKEDHKSRSRSSSNKRIRERKDRSSSRRRSKSKRRSRKQSVSDSDSSTDESDSDESSENEEDRRRKRMKKSKSSRHGGRHGKTSAKKKYKKRKLLSESNGESSDAEDMHCKAIADQADTTVTDDVGPMPLCKAAQGGGRISYGGALRPGEGDAMAQFVQQGKRIPRRGEVGLSADEISRFESLGYVMSGSRHQRMNVVRIRKENQVYSAEDKRALAEFNYEEKAKREHKVMASLMRLVQRQMGQQDA